MQCHYFLNFRPTNGECLQRYPSVNDLQLNLDYPDSLGPHEIVRIIEGPDNRKYEY